MQREMERMQKLPSRLGIVKALLLMDRLVQWKLFRLSKENYWLSIKRAEWQKTWGLQSVLIESDSQVDIKLNVSELVPPWDVSAAVWDIKRLGVEMKIEFGWIKRTANKLAHVVATKAIKGQFRVGRIFCFCILR